LLGNLFLPPLFSLESECMGFKLEISIIGMSSWLVNCYDGHFIGPVIWQPYDILDFFFWVGGGHLIGFRPFVEACIDVDEKAEALKYIPKLADPRERAEVIRPCVFFSPPFLSAFLVTFAQCPIFDFCRHMLGLAWQRKLLMLLLRQKMVNCLVDWNWVLHRIQQLHQYLTPYVIVCPSKASHRDL